MHRRRATHLLHKSALVAFIFIAALLVLSLWINLCILSVERASIGLGRGQIGIWVQTAFSRSSNFPPPVVSGLPAPDIIVYWRPSPSLVILRDPFEPVGFDTHVRVLLWVPLAICGLLAIMTRKRATVPAFRCPCCRYDLRGLPLPDFGDIPCPECGQMNRTSVPSASPVNRDPSP
jgi:hypothetical protein